LSKHIVSVAVAVFCVLLSGCHSHVLGFAPSAPPEITSKASDPLLSIRDGKSWLQQYEDNLPNCLGDNKIPIQDGKNCPDGNSGAEEARMRRNQYIDAIRAKIDDSYTKFSEDVHSGNAIFGMASDWAVLGLSGAGSVVADAGLKSVLAATSAGVTGANASYQKQVLNQQGALAIVAAMDATRAQWRTIILRDEQLSITQCSLQQALVDLRQYYAAGTILRGLNYIQGQMQNQAQSAQDEAEAIKSGLLTISETAIPQGTVGQKYQGATITVTGGTAPYTWKEIGNLPAGITGIQSGNNYVLSGTPSSAAPAIFTLQVTDSGKPQPQTVTAVFTMIVNPS